MNRLSSQLGAIAAGMAITFASIAPATAQNRITLPAGTVIPVRLDQSLDSRNSQPGDKFTGTVKDTDNAGLPYGTRVEGVVREAIPHDGSQPGVIDVDFRRIVLPNGEARNIYGQLYSLNGKDVQRRDGRLIASSNNSNDRLKWIGIGAGAGLLLGTLTHGNSLLDALLGAGAGYLYNQTQGNKNPGDVSLKSGTEFGVRLDRDVAFNVDDHTYQNRYGYNDSRSYDRTYNDRYYRSGDQYDDRYYNGDRTYRNDRYNREDDWSWRNPANRMDDIAVRVDDRDVHFASAKPFMRDGIVMVPMSAIADMTDYGYRYNSDDREIRARNGDLRLDIGSRYAYLNGARRTLPTPAEVRDGVVYVPMQFISMMVNGTASWDSTTRTLTVVTDHFRD